MAATKKSKAKPPPPETRKGPQGTALEQAQRNEEIVVGRMRGLSIGQLATQFELSKTRVCEILSEWKKTARPLRKNDPLDIADEMLDGYQADIEELVLIGLATDHDSVRVSAINTRMQARQRITELLQALGVLPNDLGELRIEIDARLVAERVVAVLKSHDVPQKVQDELIAALDGEVIDAEARENLKQLAA